MEGSELDDIRRIRHEISARFNHDVGKLVAHYQAVEQEMRKAGYKFAEPPPEKPERVKTEKTEAAG